MGLRWNIAMAAAAVVGLVARADYPLEVHFFSRLTGNALLHWYLLCYVMKMQYRRLLLQICIKA